MATSTKKSPENKAAGKAASAPQDAIALLKADHREAEEAFDSFETATRAKKIAIARKVCVALKVHTRIEEEIFYPAIKGKIEKGMVNEAVVEHASAKDLIAQIESMDGSEELFDAKVTVLGELIQHHVDEEESEMFKQARKTDVDMKALGQQMAARKAELMAMGDDLPDDEATIDAGDDA